jgi:hypothetical protein
MTDAERETEAERVADRIRARGGWVSDDLRVSATSAAEMLGISEGTLRNWSYIRRGPTPIRVAGGPRTYRMIDILSARAESWAAEK